MENLAIADYDHTGALFVPEDGFAYLGYGLEVMIPPGAKDGDSWDLEIVPFVTNQTLAHALLGDVLFVSSNQELLSEVRGNLVFSPNSSQLTFGLPNTAPVVQENHRTELLADFYNHLFIAKGRTLWWTDLDNIWEWEPHPHNEADFRTIEWESNNITALVRVGDKLHVHFPTAIYEVHYVGKPTVVRIDARVHGTGAVTSRSVVVHNNIEFFLGIDNFYIFSPETGLQQFGQAVWKKFTKTRGPIDKLWAYVDHKNNEICWVTNGTIWAFNYIDRIWSKYSADGILDQTTSPWLSTTLLSNSSVGSDSIIEPDLPETLENVWVLENCVCREARFADRLELMLPMTAPFLETDEITYGDLHFVKKVDLVTLDAKGYWPWTGLRVFVSGKDFVSHGDNWIDCGLWAEWHKLRQRDFRSVAGKVLKFRFVLEDCLMWNGLLPNGGLQLDGKCLDVADGQIIMNGAREDFLGRQFIFPDGTRTLDEVVNGDKPGYFELNAWGERVDLPQTLIGPDK